jgi:hypothetical protein
MNRLTSGALAKSWIEAQSHRDGVEQVGGDYQPGEAALPSRETMQGEAPEKQ